jgi:DNA primase
MDDIELIKSKLNIVDLVSEYVPLKKAGVNFKAPCPFHSEKTPSFMVSPERQIFKCFGCDKGGDIFKFLMEKETLEFKEALEILAKRAGVTLQRKPSDKKDERERLFEVNLKAEEFFHYILTKHKFGEKALEYLHLRGLTDKIIEEFGIGYAPNSWTSLTGFLLKRSFDSNELVNSGLAVSSKNPYDRFRGRVTFPIIDTKDRIIGFSGRVLDQGEPKYINTPQTLIFDKSQSLFGIHKAKNEIKIKDAAILVEGEMDVILSHQAGIKNVVAAKGTALTTGQIELLKRYSLNLILCFDTDLAGDSAARRGIEIAESLGMNLKVIQVEGGKDPAELITADPKLWQKAVEEAIPIYDYYLKSISNRLDPKDPAGIRAICAELIPIWAKIPDNLIREHYIQKLAAFLRTEETIIRKEIDKQQQTTQKPNYTKVLTEQQVTSTPSHRQLLEEYLMALLLHIPKDYTFIPNFPETLFVSESLRQLFVLLVIYLDSISFKGKSFDINDFLSDTPEELHELIDRLYLLDIDSKLLDSNAWQGEVNLVVAGLKKALIKASLQKLSFEIKNAQEFGRIEMVESLNRRFRDLSVKLKNL